MWRIRKNANTEDIKEEKSSDSPVELDSRILSALLKVALQHPPQYTCGATSMKEGKDVDDDKLTSRDGDSSSDDEEEEALAVRKFDEEDDSDSDDAEELFVIETPHELKEAMKVSNNSDKKKPSAIEIKLSSWWIS
ncbi:hypothetical protein Bca4012_027761 [Brassica carinata]